MGTRVFITKIDPVSNEITLSKEDSFKDEIYVSDMNFVGISEPCIGEEIELAVKVRYLAPPVAATVTINKSCMAEVVLDYPVKSVTPGQSCVFYDGDVVIGGGVIHSSE